MFDSSDADAWLGQDAESGSDALVSGCACIAGTDVACEELSGLYASDGKRAVCRDDCRAYDVAPCTADLSGSKVETVYPGLRDGRFTDARCNDGTPFWFEVSLTGSRRWVVSFEGGGVCDGELVPCQDRFESDASRFSSANDAPDRTVADWGGRKGVLSRDKSENPTFADANMAIGNYCSSDLWTGAATQSVEGDLPFELWFAGRLNARAMLRTLVERYGLSDADIDLVVTGTSAGGNGARNNADLFASAFPNARKDRRIWVIPVAGFQLYEWSYPGAGVGGSDVADPVAFDLTYQRWQSELNEKCLALVEAENLGPGACFAGLYASRSLVLPKPEGYGLRVLDATNRTDPVYLGYHGVTASTPDFTAIVDAWESKVTGEMLASGLRWMLAPAHRGKPRLHGLYDVWDVALPVYDPVLDPCSSPWPAGVTDFRSLVDAFYADTAPETSVGMICIPGGWPP